ncbi:MAG: hypothetical protein ACR2KE_08750 [Candidatus Nanopelagicales bacterium]
MKARWVLAAIASGATILCLTAPAAVIAAPSAATAGAAASPAVDKPSGKAMVRIEGGTAYSKQKAKGSYRIVMPQGVNITWMGEVAGKGVRTGTMTPKALVAAWAAMGYRGGTSATTTVTWQVKGTRYPGYQLVFLDKPRFNADGQMTVIATTQGSATLPKTMPDFSINVTRAADETPRSYSVFGPWIGFDNGNSAFVYGTATDVTKGMVVFAYGNNAATTCRQGIGLVAGTQMYTYPLTSSFPCGTYTVNATTTDGKGSYLSLTPPPGTSSTAVGSMFASFSVTPPKSSASGPPPAPFDIVQTLVTWKRNGDGVAPSVGS